MMQKYHIGQTMILVPNDSRRPAMEVTITSLGRKWAGLSGAGYINARFDIHTGRMDGRGYSSPGTLWPSWEEYHREQERVAKQTRLRNLMRRHDIQYTMEQLDAVLTILDPENDDA
jgi:hypothetical protein